MNTAVNFEIAKLLKEKGFDNYCDKKYVAQCLWQSPYNREKYKNSDIHKNSSDISAPTNAEVVMWLYEKHGIWINPIPRLSSWIFTIQEIKTISNTSLIDIDFYESNDYLKSKGVPTIMETPTEAYEAAITYTLNNLI